MRMNWRARFLVLVLGACAAAASFADGGPQPPSLLYPELFDAVQRSTIYPDSKTFADAIPKGDPAAINAAYRAQRAAAGFDLKAFVAEHFDEPEHAGTGFKTDPTRNVCQHIDALWSALTRGPDDVRAGSSLLPLPHRYVVPGGRYREVYYWDSYFTMIGLEASGRHDLVVEMVDNFAHLIDTVGHIPNGNRTYYLSRSQPPFFAAMVALVARKDGDGVYAKYLPQMRKEHDFWMAGAEKVARGSASRRVVRLPGGELLNRYWDDRATPRDESYREDVATAAESGRPKAEVYRSLRAAAESGWDFSSRWFADGKKLVTIRTTEILPVDLNSLLWKLETVIARGCDVMRRADCKKDMTAQANARKRAIVKLMWDEDLGAFLDYDWKNGRRNTRINAASAYPLFVDLAGATEARRTAKAIRTSLLEPHGLATTTESTGEQWDSPNGWAPLQWIAIDGLRRHGQEDLAQEIAKRWIAENARVYCKTGKLVEKYDVRRAGQGMGGEYPVQDGFGWTNAVLIKLFTIYPALAAPKYEFTGAECPAP